MEYKLNDNAFDVHDSLPFLDIQLNPINHKLYARQCQLDVYCFLENGDIVLTLGGSDAIIPIFINAKLYTGRNHVVLEVVAEKRRVLLENSRIHQCGFDVISEIPSDSTFYYNNKYDIITLNTDCENNQIIPSVSFDILIKAKLLFYTAIVCEKEYLIVLYDILMKYQYVTEIVKTIMYRAYIDDNNEEQSMFVQTQINKLCSLLYEKGFRVIKSFDFSQYVVWKRM